MRNKYTANEAIETKGTNKIPITTTTSDVAIAHAVYAAIPNKIDCMAWNLTYLSSFSITRKKTPVNGVTTYASAAAMFGSKLVNFETDLFGSAIIVFCQYASKRASIYIL